MYRLLKVNWNQDFLGSLFFWGYGNGTVSGKAPNDSIAFIC